MVLAVLGGAAIKVATSKPVTMRAALLTWFVAVFAAAIFTGPVLHYMAVETDVMKYAVAGMLALTGEAFVRALVSIDKEMVFKLLREWRRAK